MPDILLEGCRPEPLIDYLKALGVLRTISSQVDASVTAAWKSGCLELRTGIGRDGLEDFLLYRYTPTPMVDPWNKDSGFPSSAGDKISNKAVKAIISSTAERLSGYSSVTAMCDDLVSRFQPGAKDEKAILLGMLRSSVPDEVLDWLDAVFVLTDGDPKFPPLLGSGGNDGRLDFVNCFMRAILDVMDPATGEPAPTSRHSLRASLYGSPAGGMSDQTVGQFDPGASGGMNASSSFEGDSLSNPWSFILAMEGALMFATAASRRLEGQTGVYMGYPFTVRPTRAGYASSSPDEKLRGEMWMPLWSKHASYPEVRALFGEGRATVSVRNAQSGLDFARAVASLGVDRGLDGFTRFMFAERNGKANYAVPIGRFDVSWAPEAELFDEISSWVDSLGRAHQSSHALASCHHAIEESMMRFCQAPGRERLRRVLLELGRASALLGRSPQIPLKSEILPLQGLSTRWVEAASDGSAEYRLAAALASIRTGSGSLRLLLDPIAFAKKHRLEYVADKPCVPLSLGTVDLLLALIRRMMLAEVPECGAAIRVARGDVHLFIEGMTDDLYLKELLQALILVDWNRKGAMIPRDLGNPVDSSPGAEYWLLKLCMSGKEDIEGWGGLDPAVARAAISGNHMLAARLAAVRMRAIGRAPVPFDTRISRTRALRIASSLLIPVSRRHVREAASRLAMMEETRFTEGEDDVE